MLRCFAIPICAAFIDCPPSVSNTRTKLTGSISALRMCVCIVYVCVYIYMCVYVCDCIRVHVYSWFILFVQFILFFFPRSWRASTQRSSFTPSAQMTYCNLLPRQTWRSAYALSTKRKWWQPSWMAIIQVCYVVHFFHVRIMLLISV